jgi:hypothetical protein
MSVRLPPDILEQIDAIKQAQLDNLAETLPQLHSPGDVTVRGKRRKWKGLQKEVRDAVDRMQRADYSAAVVRREVQRLSQGHYAKARQVIVRQINDAVNFADRYADLMDYYHARERIKGFGKGKAPLLTATDSAFLAGTDSLGSAEAAVAWSMRRRERLEAPAKTVLRGSKLPAADGSGNLSLSGRLHGSRTASSRTLGAIVERGIREGQNLDEASRELIDMVKRSGGKIAGDKKLPKLLQDLRKAGAELAEGGGKAAQAKWDATVRRLQGYTRNLAPGGTVQSGYVQLLEDVNKGGPKAVNKALKNWSYRYQKYAAERIANTEAQTAYRLRQLEIDAGRPWIEAYIWRMNAAVHARFASYKKVPRKGKRKGKGRCDCEIYNGQRVTKEWVELRPQGLHPHCACRAVPIINRGRLEADPLTPEALSWMEKYKVELGLD